MSSLQAVSTSLVLCLDDSGLLTWFSRPLLGLGVGDSLFAVLEPLDSGGNSLTAGDVRYYRTRSTAPTDTRQFVVQVLAGPPDNALVLRVTERGSQVWCEGVEGDLDLRERLKLETLSVLAPSLAHELSNPIQGVLNYAELIQDTAKDGGRAAEFAREISTEAERFSRTIRALLDLTRPDPRAYRVELVADILAAVQTLMNSALMRDQISLSVEVSFEVTTLRCCGQQIRQLLLSLVFNAQDSLNDAFASYHANKRIHISAVTFAQDDEAWLRLEIRDFGTGATPTIRERAFEPWFSTRQNPRRRGLGLSVSRGIAKEHGGRLSLAAESPGLVAILELPVSGRS